MNFQLYQNPQALPVLNSNTVFPVEHDGDEFNFIPNKKGMDEWGNFPRERQRLVDLLGKTNGVILLRGNVHFAEISQLSDGPAYPLTELTSSGMTHIEELYGKAPNRFRLGQPLIELNFGLVEVNWETGHVALSACNVDGRVMVSKKLSLDSLK